MADVAVVGAGPAGAVAACLLARAGRSVLLLDPRLDGPPAWKPGDALAGAGLRLLRAHGLPVPDAGGPHRPIGGTVSAWGGAVADWRDFLREPDGPAWRLDRAVFDGDLAREAAAAGAGLIATAVRGAVRGPQGWTLRLASGGTATACWLVDATGRAAALARRLGAARHRDEELVAVAGLARPDPAFVMARSLIETTPDGWWYAALLPDGVPVFMLHTRPETATRHLADPAAWQAALAGTALVSRHFPRPQFDAAPRGYEACGAWLDPVHGPGWVACGDAALSVDPCAGQGIFSALHGGVAVAQALAAVLERTGDGAAAPEAVVTLDAYAARLAEVRRIYRTRVLAHYRQERRWPDATFWR